MLCGERDIVMESKSLNKDGEIFEVLKCKADEILFVRYDDTKDAENTSVVLNDILEYCQDNGMDCLILPKSDEKVDIALEQMDAESLRRLENKVHTHLQKKSPIILT